MGFQQIHCVVQASINYEVMTSESPSRVLSFGKQQCWFETPLAIFQINLEQNKVLEDYQITHIRFGDDTHIWSPSVMFSPCKNFYDKNDKKKLIFYVKKATFGPRWFSSYNCPSQSDHDDDDDDEDSDDDEDLSRSEKHHKHWKKSKCNVVQGTLTQVWTPNTTPATGSQTNQSSSNGGSNVSSSSSRRKKKGGSRKRRQRRQARLRKDDDGDDEKRPPNPSDNHEIVKSLTDWTCSKCKNRNHCMVDRCTNCGHHRDCM